MPSNQIEKLLRDREALLAALKVAVMQMHELGEDMAALSGFNTQMFEAAIAQAVGKD